MLAGACSLEDTAARGDTTIDIPDSSTSVASSLFSHQDEIKKPRNTPCAVQLLCWLMAKKYGDACKVELLSQQKSLNARVWGCSLESSLFACAAAKTWH
jgi:hypothetical protein